MGAVQMLYAAEVGRRVQCLVRCDVVAIVASCVCRGCMFNVHGDLLRFAAICCDLLTVVYGVWLRCAHAMWGSRFVLFCVCVAGGSFESVVACGTVDTSHVGTRVYGVNCHQTHIYTLQ